jgi:hypothetical protein
MAKKVSRIGFLRENPTATYEEFFKATGGSKQNYHSNKWIIGKEVKGAVKTRKPRKTMSVKVKAHRRHPAGTAPADLVIANGKVSALEKEISNLKHQIVGFRAVISYLEDLSGLRNSQ